MFLSKDRSRILPKSELYKEYSTTAKHPGNGVRVGDKILRSRELIFGICDDCKKEISSKYSVVEHREEFLCRGCRTKNRMYIPDVEIHFSNGFSKLVEIKPDSFLNDPVNIAKWKSAEKWCSDRDLDFEVVTQYTMLTFILRNTSENAILAYPDELLNFILNQAQKVAKNFQIREERLNA